VSAAFPPPPEHPPIDAPIGEWLAELLGTTSEHAVVFLDPEGRVVAWLGAAERLFGYTPDEAMGMPFDRVFVPEDRSLGLHRQEMVVAAASGRSEDDRWHVRKDGSRFWANGLLEVVRKPDGAVAAFCKVLRDRTDVRTQLEALHNRVAALSEQHTRRTHFLIALGHELRNPMAPLVASVAALKRSDDPEVKRRCCATLERQLAVLTRLLDDLSVATHAALGKARLETEPLNLQEALEYAAAGIAPTAAQQGQQLQLLLPPVPFEIEADPARLQQMLANLLGNAVKFTPPGGHIVLSASVEGGMAVIRVEDDGLGIPHEVLPHIFELFTRNDSRDAPEGLGVGLAVVDELARLHGGGVDARSPGTGKGSVFSLRLPLRQPAKRMQA
jgi:PAS domain S-box-containing protein